MTKKAWVLGLSLLSACCHPDYKAPSVVYNNCASVPIVVETITWRCPESVTLNGVVIPLAMNPSETIDHDCFYVKDEMTAKLPSQEIK